MSNVIPLSIVSNKSFVITGKNKENSLFYIQSKSSFIKEKETGELAVSFSGGKGWVEESEIITRMKIGAEFFTYSDGEFTPVTVIAANIKSIRNNTKKDNILEL